MSWNGQAPSQAIWTGSPEFAGSEELYTSPIPADTITPNKIGIVDGNEILLPTVYPELTTATFNSTTINNTGTTTTETLNSTNINNAENINTDTINNNPIPISAENWSQYPASSNVTAPLINNPFPLAGQSAQYDITGFKTISSNKYVGVTDNNNGTATVSTSQFNGDNIYIKGICKVGDNAGANLGNVEVYGGNLIPPLNALYVSGGTTLTGGALHGIEIGCKPVAGIDTTRIDVRQDGITIKGGSLGTYISGNGLTGLTLVGESGTNIATSGGNLDILTTGSGNNTVITTSAGTTAISSSSYMEVRATDINQYSNSVKCYVPTGDLVNNDASQIFVGSIHGAPSGAIASILPLRINESRGVEISNGTTWTTNTLNSTTISNSGTVTTDTLNSTTINNSGTATTDTLNANLIAVANILTLDLIGANITTSTFVNIPESQNLPLDWNGSAFYDLWQFILYTATSTYYFSIIADNQGNDPSTTTGSWLLANWDSGTTYLEDYPTFDPATQSFWLSNFDGNTGNFPIIPNSWDFTNTYGIDELVVYEELYYKSLQNGNVANTPNEPLSVWWVEVPIWWSPTTNYHLGNTDTGLVFTPIVAGGTGITTLVKRYGDPDEELNVIVKNTTGVELSAQSVVTSPMYKDFDMGGHNITNLGTITIGDLTVNNLTVDGTTTLNNDVGVGGNLTVSGTTILNSDLTANGSVNLHSIYDSTGGDIQVNSAMSLNNNSIVDVAGLIADTVFCDILKSPTSLPVHAPFGIDQLPTISNGSGDIEVGSQFAMGNNGILACPFIISNGGLGLTSNSGNIVLSASAGIVLSSLSGNLETGATGYTDIATGGALTLNSTSSIATLSANQDIAITSATSYITLTAGSGQDIQAHSILDMSTNNIINCPQITGAGTITVASGGTNTNVALTPNGTGLIIAGSGLNMSSNPITNLTTINGRNIFQYGSFYNSATQTLGATGTATRVVMNSGTGLGVSLDTTTNIGRISFAKDGTYLIVWNAYLVHGSGGTVKSVIWIRLNGNDVAGTGKTQNNDAQQNETNLTSSSIVTVTSSQYIEFYWASSSTTVPLTAIATSSPYPATPSFSCSISIIA
jgi:hypothetical protein